MSEPGRPTVVVGTAGHIDHGKTTLLRALTGIDADRLPEERERGMTIDVGFAHLDLGDGTAIDFVDVPGHDRLVGNMLVGAGEIDAVLLVVAADDGVRAQTLEHLELLDALGFRQAVVAITKPDLVDASRIVEVEDAVRGLVDRTAMTGAPIVTVSGVTGDGLATLRARLLELRAAVEGDLEREHPGPIRLPIDRAFTVRGRGAVVTGTLRGGSVRTGSELRVEPSEDRRIVRVREVQVHHGRADRADGGRTALNLAGIEAAELARGQVLTAGEGVVRSDRFLAAVRRPVSLGLAGGTGEVGRVPWPPRAHASLRLHLWTENVEARIGPTGARWLGADAEASDRTLAGVVRTSQPVAVAVGARAVVRDPGSGSLVAAVTVLDPRPPRGVSRRRSTPGRLAALAAAVRGWPAGTIPTDGAEAALLELHGFRGGLLAPDVEAALTASAAARAGDGIAMTDLRAEMARELRRLTTVERGSTAAASSAVDRVIGRLVEVGRLARSGDRLADASRRAAVDEGLAAAMARLEALLDANVPPSLRQAARDAGCPPEGLRQLESAGRIVRVEDDLAWGASRYASLQGIAVQMARREPLSPAAFRDAIGGNRRVVLAFLEDLGRRGVLRRTDGGHVPGPRA